MGEGCITFICHLPVRWARGGLERKTSVVHTVAALPDLGAGSVLSSPLIAQSTHRYASLGLR